MDLAQTTSAPASAVPTVLEVLNTFTMTGRTGIAVAALVKSGRLEGSVLLQSQTFGDRWHVREMVLRGAGLEHQEKRKQGKRVFLFEAINTTRDPGQGELFQSVEVAP